MFIAKCNLPITREACKHFKKLIKIYILICIVYSKFFNLDNGVILRQRERERERERVTFFLALPKTYLAAKSVGETKRPTKEREKDGLLLDRSCRGKPARNCSTERENVCVRSFPFQPVF